MTENRRALLEQEIKDVCKLASTQYFDIALFAKNYRDEDYAAERIAYETTLNRHDKLKTELASLDQNNG